MTVCLEFKNKAGEWRDTEHSVSLNKEGCEKRPSVIGFCEQSPRMVFVSFVESTVHLEEL